MVINICNTKKERQYNGQKEKMTNMTNKDRQNNSQKTSD